MFSATSRSTAKGLSVSSLTLRISPRRSSAGRKPPPRTPRPAALETAATSSAMETPPMPARMMGCSMPSRSVIWVRIIAVLLSPLEPGRALLEEGGGRLLQVLRLHRLGLEEGGDVQGHVELVAQDLVHGVLRPAQRHGCALGEALRPGDGRGQHLLDRHRAVDQADLDGFLARDPVAGEQ